MYAYCANSPTVTLDPTGLQLEPLDAPTPDSVPTNDPNHTKVIDELQQKFLKDLKKFSGKVASGNPFGSCPLGYQKETTPSGGDTFHRYLKGEDWHGSFKTSQTISFGLGPAQVVFKKGATVNADGHIGWFGYATVKKMRVACICPPAASSVNLGEYYTDEVVSDGVDYKWTSLTTVQKKQTLSFNGGRFKGWGVSY